MRTNGTRFVIRIFGSATMILALSMVSCSTSNRSDNAADLTGQIADNSEVQGQEEAKLTDPPLVPPPISRKYSTKVLISLEIREEIQELAEGVKYNFWTFGGKVPGKFIRVRAGDEIEFKLHNHPDNKNPHNIDLHAVNGPGGGAAASLTAPGHTSVFSFKTLNPGLYIYHCATAPVGMHIANGMYGLILVEPKEGMPKVDREYYVVQGDFYTKGPTGQAGLQPFSMDKAIREDADYVVFNGSMGSLLGDKALTAKVGETVRIYIGNGGPNLTSSFHVIGEIFDKVYIEGGSAINENVQTTLVPPGGAAIVDFKVNAPGNFILVDHAITRAFNKGALGMLKVDGKEVSKVYSGKQKDEVYLPEGSRIRSAEPEAKPVPLARTLSARIAAGSQVYAKNCAACHQADGSGIENAFPPLAKSDWLNRDVNRSIRVVLDGLSGPIEVNGKKYNAVMPAWQLNDEEVANVLSYIYNSWGNSGKEVTPAQVKSQRGKGSAPQGDGIH